MSKTIDRLEQIRGELIEYSEELWSMHLTEIASELNQIASHIDEILCYAQLYGGKNNGK